MLTDYLIQPIKETSHIQLGKTLTLMPEGFEKMLTYNEHTRFSNPWIVNACRDALQKHVGNAEVIVSAIHVERNSLLQLNLKTNQVVKVTDAELLDAPIESLIGSRAIIKIEVRGLHDEYVPAIAINLNEHGEEIAIGGSVDVCSNFTILSSERRFTTHKRHRNKSKQRMTTTELLTKVNSLFPQTEKFLAQDLQIIEQLKNQPVSQAKWNEFMGGVFSQIHYVNRKRLNKQIATVPENIKNLPITASLLADIAAEAIEPAHDIYKFVDEYSTKWNCLNYGTEKIKAIHGLSPKLVLDANSNWTNLLLKHNFNNKN